MNLRTLLLRALIVLAGVAGLVLLSPGAAFACGISYEPTPASPASGCSATAAVTGIAIVGTTAVGVAATLVVTNFLRGAMSGGNLAALLAEISTAGGLPDAVTLVDGTRLRLLDQAGQQAMASYATTLANTGRTRDATQVGPEYDYQRDKLGATEYDVAPDATRETWADGLDRLRGSAQDAKYRDSGERRSFYDPQSLPPALREFAVRDMDRRLTKYLAAINDPANPLRVLEVVTNDLGVARFIRERMASLGVPGFVRVEI